ncbi:MAG: sugar transferase [Clostridia bacterium]|nr:sugar transferase [Clostridia bacterium]
MLIKKWDKLPEFMKNDAVRPYYEHLRKKNFSLFIKRVFDFLVSTIMLLILSPVFIILAIAIKIDSKGPVFYRQVRVTQYGKKFKIFKFRTMVQNADAIGAHVTAKADARITKVGKFIRKCRLDEVSQLIDVWRGKMTFVGTRPEVPEFVDKYTPEMMATLLLPAGVTSKASIFYKDEDEILAKCEGETSEVYLNEILPEKMKYNLQAIKEFSLFSELKTMFQTVGAVLKKGEEPDENIDEEIKDDISCEVTEEVVDELIDKGE